LYELMEKTDGWTAKAIDLSILVMILISITLFALDTDAELNRQYGATFEQIQRWLVYLFTVEYLLRLVAAGGRKGAKGSGKAALAYAISFYGIVDLLAILPFYLEATGLLALRSLRVLRLLRLFKITRYNDSLGLLIRVMLSRADQLGVCLLVSSIVMFVAATGIYYTEGTAQPKAFPSIPASLWWAMVTLTTVGYGDTYPVTLLGKLFTSVICMVGLGVLAIPTGIISSGLVEAMDERRERKRLEDLGKGQPCPHCGKHTGLEAPGESAGPAGESGPEPG